MREEKKGDEVVTHLSREEARSGASTHVTRYVLSISLVLVVIAFAIMLATGFFNTAKTGADETHVANTTEAGGG